MPELPEVEVVVRGLSPLLKGKVFQKVSIKKAKMTNFTAAEFKKKIKGKKISQVERVGKMIIIYLDGEDGEGNSPLLRGRGSEGHLRLVFHLKMTGQLVYEDLFYGGHTDSSFKKRGKPTSPSKHARLIFTFMDKTQLFFNDQRIFGYCHLIPSSDLPQYINKYGLDPINSKFSWVEFWKIVQAHSNMNFKAFLLNQKYIAGLGNIYADEIAFRSGIDPRHKLERISKEDWKKTHRNIRKVLNESIKLNGTTFSTFLTADGRRGNFTQSLKVYGRQDQPCLQCGTKLKKLKLAGRGTVVCDTCQL